MRRPRFMQWGISMRRTLTACSPPRRRSPSSAIHARRADRHLDARTSPPPPARSMSSSAARPSSTKGLVGAGRVSATSRDFNGDTLGSFSACRSSPAPGGAMPTAPIRAVSALPDRGPNFSLNGFPGTFFSNYAARINQFSFTFNPIPGPAISPRPPRRRNPDGSDADRRPHLHRFPRPHLHRPRSGQRPHHPERLHLRRAGRRPSATGASASTAKRWCWLRTARSTSRTNTRPASSTSARTAG